MKYCTLFDSNYLDKGLVMIKSLFNVDQSAEIYVLCMDDKAKSILDELNFNRLATIALSEFEDEELLRVKPFRSKGEYCWTCTGKLIRFILEKYRTEICVYVDSDLYFYSDPKVLIKEMKDNKCEVLVVPHRFPPTTSGQYQEKENGRNCVQFNAFSNTPNSMSLLRKWIEQCVQECSVNTAGDQKYTDPWYEIPYVRVSKNGGAGIAPWNLTRYKLIDRGKKTILDRYEKKQYQAVFYHFQNITYVDRLKVRVMPKVQYWYIDSNLMDYFYINYLVKIEKEKKMLKEKYNIVPVIKTYIATKEKEKKALADRIVQLFREPFSISLMKIGILIRLIIRKKQTIIDISKYL